MMTTQDHGTDCLMEMGIKASTLRIVNPLYPLYGIFTGTTGTTEQLN
jgi:hypothetical protein